ncbi:hypothetical protein ACFL0V_01005 [Nanoarchaeota archaeon]
MANALWLLLLIFIITIFPLYLTVKLLGGKITLLSALGIKIVAFLLALLIAVALGAVGPLLIALALIILYRFAFRIGIIRAFLAWFLEGVVMVALLYIMTHMGIATAKLSSITASFSHLATLL